MAPGACHFVNFALLSESEESEDDEFNYADEDDDKSNTIEGGTAQFFICSTTIPNIMLPYLLP